MPFDKSDQRRLVSESRHNMAIGVSTNGRLFSVFVDKYDIKKYFLC